MAIIQFPLRHGAIWDMDTFAEVLPVHACAFPQLYNSVFTIHLIFSIKQKYTLRTYYSIATLSTQRVNCKFLRSLFIQRLRLFIIVGTLRFFQSIRFFIFQDLMTILLNQPGHYIHTAVKCRIIFCFLIIFSQ